MTEASVRRVCVCRPPQLLLSSAACFGFLFAGYCGLAASPDVITTCLSTMLRSLGSSVLWVYSTLLLQLRVPDGLLGRMLALEVAFFTVSRISFLPNWARLLSYWHAQRCRLFCRRNCLSQEDLADIQNVHQGWSYSISMCMR